jgi:hypothetical protein
MDIGTVQNAIEAAVHHFGLGRLCRLDALFAGLDGHYMVRLVDTRKSRFVGPVFSFTIDVREHSTPDAIRDFTKSQIVDEFAKPSN